jgi:hypothetical protein
MRDERITSKLGRLQAKLRRVGAKVVFDHRLAPLRDPILTRLNRARFARAQRRRLEIGPGLRRIDGFETAGIIPGRSVDYVLDAADSMPFEDGTFELVYASHVLEHIPWYLVPSTLAEWVRIVASGGAVEIWVPDGLKICRAFVDAEDRGADTYRNDGWYKFNPEEDAAIWANGRVFSYGDGAGDPCSPMWHRSLFSARLLRRMMEQAGLTEIREMDRREVRGDDHGWINLGLRGTKPATTG